MPTIMVPLDGSEKDARALAIALALADLADAELRLVHVLEGIERSDDTNSARRVAGARLAASADRASIDASCAVTFAVLEGHHVVEEIVTHAADNLTSRQAAVEVQVAEGTDPAAAIVAAIREYLVELIAMSTRGTGGLRRLVLGSVAERVVRASEVPVLLLTPATLAAGNPDTRSGVH